jgi:hypothetical protein
VRQHELSHTHREERSLRDPYDDNEARQGDREREEGSECRGGGMVILFVTRTHFSQRCRTINSIKEMETDILISHTEIKHLCWFRAL